MLYCFRKLPIKEYYYNRVLEELGLTKDEVIITVDKHMYPIIDNVVMAYIYSVSLIIFVVSQQFLILPVNKILHVQLL